MAKSRKHGKANIPEFGNNEPVFILRAQDKQFEASIGVYKLLAAARGSKVAASPDKEIESSRKQLGAKKLAY